MTKAFLLGVMFAVGLLLGYLVIGPAIRAQAQVTDTPTPEPTETAAPTRTKPAHTPTITPTMITMVTVTGTPQPFPTQISISGGLKFGLTGEVQCWNCAPFAAKVHLSNYDPMAGPINCWDYDKDKQYCYSPTKLGIAWKAVWGFGAACPKEWKMGTWIQIPNVGTFICFDRGSSIVCDPQSMVCNVDILGPSGPWNGSDVDVTLWVPLDPPREEK
jgi:hypothetical protein